jgi:flagellar assembly protein FliH
MVTSGADADGARAVRFDRPLLDLHSWADPRLARDLAEVSRAAREQGLAEGYAAGWAQGRRAAAETERTEATRREQAAEAVRRQTATRAESLLTALAATARTIADQAAPAWDELVDVMLDGSLRLAGVSLQRELASVDSEVLEATRTALRLLPAGESVTLHVHPDDVALLVDPAVDLPAGLSVTGDPTVAAGTVVARTPLHSLPMDLRAALRVAEEVLRS